MLTVLNPLNAFSKLSGVTQRSMRRNKRTTREIHDRAVRALQLLTEAEDAGCTDAIALRADIRLFPPNGFRQDLGEAFQLYTRFLDNSSDPHAQFIMGFFYATGLGGAPRDQARATLYYTFSALQGYKPAQMAMGNRYWSGIGVKQDCQAALDYYESAAKETYARFTKGPPGGETLPLTPWRLSNRFGGVYGPQASWAFTGVNARRDSVRAHNQVSRGESPDELLEYLEFTAARGNWEASRRIGWYNYVGSTYPHVPLSAGAEETAEIPKSFNEAKKRFLHIARQVWPSEFDKNNKAVKAKENVNPALMVEARVAAAFLGRMSLRGEGLKQDYRRARLWFIRAGNRPEAGNGLGIIYRDGLGVKADPTEAISCLEHSAGQDYADAEVNLGKHLLAQNERGRAAKYFESAIQHGSSFEPFYHLGGLHAEQARGESQKPGACGVAVGYYKLVSETGSWDSDFLGDANRAWLRGEHDKALLGWWIAAEMGIETGQNNVAFLLDRGADIFEDSPVLNDTSLVQWTRSAAQGDGDAMVVVGDRYCECSITLLTLDAGLEPNHTDYTRALAFYQSAAEVNSAMAYWNVGWMHENGLGVPQDWHLAKRNYDHALDVSPHAYLPWLLSIGRLYIRSWVNQVRTGGAEPGLNLFEEEEQVDRPTLWEGVKRLFLGPQAGGMAVDDAGDAGDAGDTDNFAAGWEGEEAGGDGDDEVGDLIDAIDDLLESFLVIAIVLAISGLFWLRGRWANQAMRQAQAAVAR